MTVPLPHFGSGGDLPLVITKKNDIFFIIKMVQKVVHIKAKII